MSTIDSSFKTTVLMTAEQLLAMPDDGNRYELIDGKLLMMSPSGNVHGETAANITALLWNHVRHHRLGKVFAAETGFLLARNPDKVRAPDVAFVANDSLPDSDPGPSYLAQAPDLAVEVVSPNDTSTQVETKAQMWIESGTAMVLVVDPATRTVRVYRTKDSIDLLISADELDASDVVAGWKPVVGEFFS
jgi:Uma2 family endonuclease